MFSFLLVFSPLDPVSSLRLPPLVQSIDHLISCSHLGAHVIGTTSSEEKAELAKQSGAEHVILYGEGRDVVSEVYKLTGGEGIDRGVHAVFDGVGKDTFDMDFDLLRRCVSLT